MGEVIDMGFEKYGLRSATNTLGFLLAGQPEEDLTGESADMELGEKCLAEGCILVDIPDKCPCCKADLTSPSAIRAKMVIIFTAPDAHVEVEDENVAVVESSTGYEVKSYRIECNSCDKQMFVEKALIYW